MLNCIANSLLAQFYFTAKSTAQRRTFPRTKQTRRRKNDGGGQAMERSFFSQPRWRRSSLVSPSSIKRRRSCHDRWAALAEARCCRWLRASPAVVPSSAYLLRVLRPARTGVMYTLHMPITAGPELLRTFWIRGPGSEISTACTA